MTFTQGLYFLDEFSDVLEASVNGCVPDIRHLIELVQGIHHLGSENMGGDFAAEILFKGLKDVGTGVFEQFPAHRPFFTGLEHPIQKFVSVKRLASAIPFEDPEIRALNFLVRGEPGSAVHALATPPDTPAVLGQSGVDDFVLHVAAFGAVHLVVFRRIPP